MAVMVYGCLNAVLYAGLLPLWDGFDEPFHYSYVQQLWRQRSFPVLGRSVLTCEVWNSLALAPGSYIVKRNLPQVIAFDEYFRLPEGDRAALRSRLEQLDSDGAGLECGGLNYEAQQAPLAYVVLAPFDMAWRKASLMRRVLRLRLLCGLASTLATGGLTFRLAGQFGLCEPWRSSAVFLVFSSQMFYATVAHVANDWLAVPLFTWVLSATVSLSRAPSAQTAGMPLLGLSAGLLTKAYFLALVPLALAAVVRCVIRHRIAWGQFAILGGIPMLAAGGWYGRNLVLYKSLSGTQQTVTGASMRDLMPAARALPWGKAIEATLRSSLWTGSNSATTFGSKTIGIMLALLLVAGLMYLCSAIRNGWPAAERLVFAGLLSYAMALVYQTLVLFISSRGLVTSPPPWYVQTLLPAGMCLLIMGAARNGRAGEVVRISMLCAWVYVISATYVAKLIPAYAGYARGHVHAWELLGWYRDCFGQICRTLDLSAMIPEGVVWALTGALVPGAVALALRLAHG